MSAYIEPIKTALLFFPFVAALISIPFILLQYHKFGSVSFAKSAVLYSFVLYFICAYFLIILPLPSWNEVKELTTPRMQLIPFSFVGDFIRETPLKLTIPSTYLAALKHGTFIIPAYNILLTIPFGLYLRYYFNTSFKKTLLFSFLLTLFFELTQLSGLYFIYPRGYRLFDVDDLMLNTLGGILGWLIAPAVIKILPSREEMNQTSLKHGRVVSGRRRFTCLVLDFTLYCIFNGIVILMTSHFLKMGTVSLMTFAVYYVILPSFIGSRTLGEMFLNMKVVSENSHTAMIYLFVRTLLFVALYMAIPIALVIGATCVVSLFSDYLRAIILLSTALIIFAFYMVIAIKFFFTNKPMLYEKLSKTKIISTISMTQTNHMKKDTH